MIDLAKTLYPEAEWRVEDMRRLGDLGEFDGIYSWDGFFHLLPSEQRAAIPDFASRIRAGGAMLLTVGDREGEITGFVDGETVYHASLSAEEYQTLFHECGFSDVAFVANDETCEGRSFIFAAGKKT